MTLGRLFAVGTTAALIGGASTPAQSAAHDRFSFHTVEFLAEEQRAPAVQAFVAGALRVGMPLSEAAAVLTEAGARCRPFGPAAVRCTYVSFQSPPLERLQDVVWTVQVNADPTGKVRDALIEREVWG